MATVKERYLNYIIAMIGTTFLAVAINVFFEPNHVVNGGASGLGIIIASLSKEYWGFEIPVALTNLLINVPLITAGYFAWGKKFVQSTIFATAFLSLSLILTKPLPSYSGDFFLVSVCGGLLAGTGVALVIRSNATTGGTELAALLLNRLFAHLSIANLILVIDTFIILIGFVLFGFERTLYAALSVFVTSKMIDTILEGMHYSKASFIISHQAQSIATAIISELERGVTALSGKGAYTDQTMDVLLCVVSRKEMVHIKRIVKEVDPNAFIIVADVREVLGEGFKSNV